MNAIDTPASGLRPLDCLVQLSKLLFSDEPVETLSDRLAQLSQRTVAQAHVLVTLMSADEARTVVFTSDLARELDERQYESGSGRAPTRPKAGSAVRHSVAGGDPAVREQPNHETTPRDSYSPTSSRCSEGVALKG